MMVVVWGIDFLVLLDAEFRFSVSFHFRLHLLSVGVILAAVFEF